MNIMLCSRSGAALFALVVLLTSPLMAAHARARGGPGWTEITIPASGPSARAGHTMTSLDGEAYLFGGLGASAPLNDLWRFDTGSGAFLQVNATNPPPARRNHAAAEFDGKLFVFGGLGAGGGTFLDDVWSYDPSTNAWTEVATIGARPDARAFHRVVTYGDRIYFGSGFGPSSAGAFIDRWAFDPATSMWTRLFPAAGKGELDTNIIIDPCGRYGPFVFLLELCAIFGGGIDCFVLAVALYGGETFDENSKLRAPSNDALLFDPATGGFKPLLISGDAPPPLVLGSSATFRPRSDGNASTVILIGGETGGGGRSMQTFILSSDPDPIALRFTSGPDLPVALSESAATYIPDFPFAGSSPGPGVLVFGGRLANNSVTSRAFVLPAEAAPAGPDLTGEWTTAPSQKCKNNKCRVSGTFVARNTGTADAGAASVTFFLSEDAIFDEGDTQIRTSDLPAMTAGASATFDLKKKQRIKLPNGVSASGKYVIAVVDSSDTIDEGGEGNNAIAAQVP